MIIHKTEKDIETLTEQEAKLVEKISAQRSKIDELRRGKGTPDGIASKTLKENEVLNILTARLDHTKAELAKAKALLKTQKREALQEQIAEKEKELEVTAGKAVKTLVTLYGEDDTQIIRKGVGLVANKTDRYIHRTLKEREIEKDIERLAREIGELAR